MGPRGGDNAQLAGRQLQEAGQGGHRVLVQEMQIIEKQDNRRTGVHQEVEEDRHKVIGGLMATAVDQGIDGLRQGRQGPGQGRGDVGQQLDGVESGGVDGYPAHRTPAVPQRLDPLGQQAGLAKTRRRLDDAEPVAGHPVRQIQQAGAGKKAARLEGRGESGLQQLVGHRNPSGMTGGAVRNSGLNPGAAGPETAGGGRLTI